MSVLDDVVIRQLALEDPKVLAEMERLDGLDRKEQAAEIAPA